MSVLAVWQPIEVISLVSILVTGAIGVATIVTSHLREKDLHQRTIEAERAKPYRGPARDIINLSREATGACRKVLGEAIPTTSDGVDTLLDSMEQAGAAVFRAEQATAPFVTLGWSADVREAANRLNRQLLKISISLFMPRAWAQGGIPESPSIALGDEEFWSNWHADFVVAVEDAEQLTRDYEAAIAV